MTARDPEITRGGSVRAGDRLAGRRALAHVVDTLLLGALFAMLVDAFGSAWDLGWGFGGEAGFAVGLFPLLGFLAVAVLYYVSFEGYAGQTIGKMLLGIRVVREADGGAPGTRAALIRTVLRPLDGVFFYLVALAAMLASGKGQRIGDMAARTLVVRG